MDRSRFLNAQLESLQSQVLDKLEDSENEVTVSGVTLQTVTKALQKPQSLEALVTVLKTHEFPDHRSAGDEFQWFALAKSVSIIIDNVIKHLFAQSLSLSEEIRYWEQTRASPYRCALYGLQTLPSRVWSASSPIKNYLQEQYYRITSGTIRYTGLNFASIAPSIFPHLQNKANIRLVSLDALIRQEIKKKLNNLLNVRDAQARILGAIVTEVNFSNLDELREDVVRIVALLESVCIPMPTEQDIESTQSIQTSNKSPKEIAQDLIILCQQFKLALSTNRDLAQEHIRPSILTRYWLFGIAIYFAGSRVLRTISNRRKDINIWFEEAVQTCKSFWDNWIVEPICQILAVIRHDEGSEIALLGKRSLSSDMESLERMLLEFGHDYPDYVNSHDAEVIRVSAQEGDLSPVLRAYESNIKSPIKNAIFGSLVRSLLIQVQKTKVDVEVAINGIDKLLKSQELVFGFVGVSPALLILWSTTSWLFNRAGNRRGISANEANVVTVNTLYNIDRRVAKSLKREKLSYKTRGLILCDVQVLRSNARSIPSGYREDYLRDLTDLEQAPDANMMKQILDRVLSRTNRVMPKIL